MWFSVWSLITNAVTGNLISFSLFLLMLSTSLRIDASTQSSVLVSSLPPSFLFISILEFKAWCKVIYFLVFLSICLSSSMVHFRNGPECLTWGTAQLFIPLMRFLLQSLVSWNFLVLVKYSYLFFLSFLFSLCPLPIFPHSFPSL